MKKYNCTILELKILLIEHINKPKVEIGYIDYVYEPQYKTKFNEPY